MTTFGTPQHDRTPSGMKVAPRKYTELEMIANKLCPLLPKCSGMEESKWKIDAWRVLEQTLVQAKYKYHIEENDSMHDCAAFCIPENKLIVLRCDVYDGLFCNDPFSRSTVIHELSHIILNHSATLHRDTKPGKHKFYEDSEWQAKALTAAIMMPIKACRKVHTLHELSQLCGTSTQAAGYRVNKLVERRILDEQHYEKSLFDTF